jgi:hypothetical protein
MSIVENFYKLYISKFSLFTIFLFGVFSQLAISFQITNAHFEIQDTIFNSVSILILESLLLFGFRKTSKKNFTFLNISFFCFIYSLGYTSLINALKFSIDTDIILLKTILKFLFYSNLIILLYNFLTGRKLIRLIVWNLLLFLTIPFTNSLIFGPIKSIPIFIYCLGILSYLLQKYPRRFTSLFVENRKYNLLFLFAVLSYLISNLFNGSFIISLDLILLQFIGFFVYIIIKFMLINKLLKIENIFFENLNIIYIQIFVLFYSIVNLLTTNKIEYFLNNKLSVLAGVNTNDLGLYFLICIPILFYFIKNYKNYGLNIFLILFLLLLMPIIRSRTAAIVLLNSSILIFIFKNNFKFRKPILYLNLSFFVFLAIFLYFYPQYIPEETLMARIFIWRLGIESLKENWLMGVGAGNYNFYISKLSLVDYSHLKPSFLSNFIYVPLHNLFLQWWMDGGLLFLIFINLFFLFHLLKLLRQPNSKIKFFQLFILLSIFVHGLFNFTFMIHANWILTCLVLGMNISYNKINLKLLKFYLPPKFSFVLISSIFIIINYYSFLNIKKYNALELLKQNRQYGRANELILHPPKEESTILKYEKAEFLFLDLPPWFQKSANIIQYLGEINLMKWKFTKNSNHLIKAENYYISCMENSINPSFCGHRFTSILQLNNATDEKLEPFFEKLNIVDPLCLYYYPIQ